MVQVREKMLLSSSREEVKTALGKALFEADYHCTEKGDVTWATYRQSREIATAVPLTDVERIKAEVESQESAGKAVTKSVAMGSVNFQLEPSLREQIGALVAGGGVNVIECALTEAETIGLTEARTLDLPSASIGATISASSPSFVLVIFPKSAAQATASAGGLFKSTSTAIFVYCCPFGASPRQKMTYSTAKAAVVAGAGECGLVFDKTIEVMNDEGMCRRQAMPLDLCVTITCHWSTQVNRLRLLSTRR